MAKDMLGVCVVGTGNISERHVSGWKELPYARLAVACDIDADVAEVYAKKHGFEAACTDYKEALARDDVDLVSVCTPAGLHPDVTVCAAQNGKHVICEKPMALTLAECDRMIEAAQKTGIKFMIAHMERFSKQTAKLRELISSGAIGRPVMVLKGNTGFNNRPVFHDKHGNGGPIVDGCIHAFDSWRVIFESDPVHVMGRGFTFGEFREELKDVKELAPDMVSGMVEYASGDVGTIITCNSMPPAIPPEQQLRVEEYIGPMGKIIGGVRSKLTLIRADGSMEEFPADNFQNWFHEEIRLFAEAVRSDGDVPITGADGKMSVSVALGILQSVETGESVRL
ncbi:MAG: Gfo/Idh/MocA family oxidoreductase [Planctomycetes bacterium]|nr:Gfo/Idh/MocA family oxidoreductase [Planctomycetota bacterium]